MIRLPTAAASPPALGARTTVRALAGTSALTSICALAGTGALASICALAGIGALSAVSASAHTPRAAFAGTSPAPTQSSELLWATVDLCNAPRHPHTIGIRGSMPGDGHPHDTMYMRFTVQSLSASTQQWTSLGKSADSGLIVVGSAAIAREAGRSFEFKPSTSPYTLRGMVEFQWRRDGHVVRHVDLPTTARHTSSAGAEPKGFSAATCELK